MTLTLKKQLTALCVASLLGGALVWNVGASRAQNGDQEITRRKLTRDEAAKRFVSLIEIMSRQDNTSFIGLAKDIISDETDKELNYQTPSLIEEMASQWKQFKQTVTVQSEGDKTAVVIVENDLTPPLRPIVLIEENGGWGVDLVETYAKWNNLEGVAKAEAIYKLTGVVLDGMPVSEQLRRRQCQTNLKQIALGIAQYVQDYDEKYPPAKHWIDNLQPYLKSEAIFNCPALPKGARYGYAFNSKLFQKFEPSLGDTSKIVSLYETSVLKRDAYGIGENPAFRHQNGANYGFADGHVKWFPKTQVPSFNIGKGVKPPVYNGAPPPMGMPPADE